MQALEEGEYEVCIDSTLQNGHLTYGECFLSGRTSDEVLISCHVCHPSLANDNLSGISVATFLAQFLASLFLSVPVCSGHDWSDHMAVAKSGGCGTDPPRFGVDVPWRCWPVSLQKEPPRKHRN
jgi:hypothetical protein